MREDLEYVAVSPSWAEELSHFFSVLIANKDDVYYHPHPLTYDMARRIAAYEGEDLYFLQIKDNVIVGYAMLRGWDEGYATPSLGIAMHPKFRNQGLGFKFMKFLHREARAKGATTVRVKVYQENAGARNLYGKCGYTFTAEENGQLIGHCNL